MAAYPVGQWVSKAEVRHEWSQRIPPEWFTRKADKYVRNRGWQRRGSQPTLEVLINSSFAATIKNLITNGHIEREFTDGGRSGGQRNYRLRLNQVGRDYMERQKGIPERRLKRQVKFPGRPGHPFKHEMQKSRMPPPDLMGGIIP